MSLPPLWQHQERAVNQCEPRPGSLLHMGLGTGKTRVAVELLDRWGADRALVICPLSVIPTWTAEVQKFSARPWHAVGLHGSRRLEQAQAALEYGRQHHRPVLLVINYESVYREPFGTWLRQQAALGALIVDESHRLKSHRGVQSKYVDRLAQSVPRRLALTGTPMPAGPMDIFAQMRFIDRSLFGSSFFRFRGKYARMGGYGGHEIVGYKNVDDFKQRLARVTFQAGREVLDLPDATHTTITCTLGKRARKAYTEMSRDLRTQIEQGEITAQNGLVKLLRLQQLTGGVAALDDSLPVRIDTAKQDALRDLLDSVEPQEPFVVFGQFSADLEAVHEAARQLGRGCLELSGKRNQLAEWKRGDEPILAVQIHSGGTGVDLTRACYCAYFSTGFNLGDFEQSLARSHRPGQNRPVRFYHLIADETVDRQVYGALRSKKRVVDAILNHLKGHENARH